MAESRFPSGKHEITIEVDEALLAKVNDETLALWWHVAQANPADGFAGKEPGEIAMKVGWEIIRRWLKKAPVEMYHHQQEHYFWRIASSQGKWTGPDRSFVPNEPIGDPHTVMRALADAAVFARKTAFDNEQAERYELLLRQLQEQGKADDA